MEIVTGSTGEAHVTPIDDAVRNSNLGYYGDKIVFNVFSKFEAQNVTANLVRVFSGYGMNQGRLFKIGEGSYDDVTIENGQQGAKRADLIVARYTMDTQTGFEDISLAVIKGSAGQEYVDPSYTTGDINSGATLDEFPLYRVKINGIVIEDVEQMFTLLPAGGRMGAIEAKIDNHIADKANPHEVTKAQVGLGNVPNVATNNQTPTYTEAGTLENITSGEVLSTAFGKIKKAIATLINHISNKSNPHEVGGSQLTDAVPISKGGTGATTAAGALQALGIPSSVADAMAKNVYTDTTNDVILVSKGGTGKASITQGKVLVGNGTSAPTEKGIDTTSGGTANSTDLITSGAVNSKVTEMQTTFQAGVDTIYNAEVAQGVTPSASTPQALATGIGTIASNKYTAGRSQGRKDIESTVESVSVFLGSAGTKTISVTAGYYYAFSLPMVNNLSIQSGGTILESRYNGTSDAGAMLCIFKATSSSIVINFAYYKYTGMYAVLCKLGAC